MRAWALVLVVIAGCGTSRPARDAGGAPDDALSATDTGGSSCATCSTDLFPMAVGMRWDYAITRGARAGCDAGTVSVTITGTGTDSAGDTFYTRTMSCGSYPTSDVKRVGDTLYIRSGGTDAWYVFMTLPPVDGATFAAGGASGAQYLWTAMPSVTVPEGTHGGCFGREQVGYDNHEVYCPGVGAVSSDFHAFGQDEGYDLTGRSP